MNSCRVEYSNISRQRGNRFEMRWQILFQLLPQFSSECKSERIIWNRSTFTKVITKRLHGHFFHDYLQCRCENSWYETEWRTVCLWQASCLLVDCSIWNIERLQIGMVSSNEVDRGVVAGLRQACITPKWRRYKQHYVCCENSQ